jgi:hypothetical protein
MQALHDVPQRQVNVHVTSHQVNNPNQQMAFITQWICIDGCATDASKHAICY